MKEQAYGAGLLNKLPLTAVDSEEKQLTVLTKFFQTGVVLELYELINNKVVRVHGHLETPVIEWVTDEHKIAEIQRVMKLGGRKPTNYFNFLGGFQMLVPDEEAHGDPITIQLPDGSKFEFLYKNMVSGLQRLRKIHGRLASKPAEEFEKEPLSKEEYVDFHQQIMDEIIECQKAGVVYMLS